MKANDILRRIRKYEATLRNEHQVKALFLFGSFARNEATRDSDVDLLVEFSSNEIGLFQFVRLKDFLQQIIGRRIDLVTRDAVKDWMRASVEEDSIRAA